MSKYTFLPSVLALSKFLHEVADMPPRGGWPEHQRAHQIKASAAG